MTKIKTAKQNKILNIEEIFDTSVCRVRYTKNKPFLDKNNLGVIENFREVHSEDLEDAVYSEDFCGFQDGFKITTEKGNIFFLIDNGQNCCENWGYITTDDDLSQYIGANLLNIELVDDELNTVNIEYYIGAQYEEPQTQFITVKTDKGVFQFAVYNAHNGYYSHDIYAFIYDKCILASSL